MGKLHDIRLKNDLSDTTPEAQPKEVQPKLNYNKMRNYSTSEGTINTVNSNLWDERNICKSSIGYC